MDQRGGSTMRDYTRKFCETSPEVKKKIQVVQKWVEGHGKIWSRHVLYLLVGTQLVKDTSQSQYDQTCKLFQNLREYGIIPYEWFKDKRTNVGDVGIQEYGDFNDHFRWLCKHYTQLDARDRQPFYVEIWTEKELSEDTLEVIDKYDVSLVTGQGFIGSIPLHDAKNRINHIANEIGKPVRIIYISDYDSEGEHIFHLCKQNLEPIGDVQVEKLFLTKVQVKQYNLISNVGYVERMEDPRKIKSHLSKRYVQGFIRENKDLGNNGVVQYELDAVDVDIVKAQLENTISRYIDRKIIENNENERIKEVQHWTRKYGIFLEEP